MNSIERASRVLANRRERRANDARLRHLRSTPSGRAILAYENGQTLMTLALAVDIADFGVHAVHELVLPPDAQHPKGSRWVLQHVAAAPAGERTPSDDVRPDGIGGSWSRQTPDERARDIYTFERVPLRSERDQKPTPVGTDRRFASD